MLDLVRLCLHKEDHLVEVTTLSDPHRVFLCLTCSGVRHEHWSEE